MTDCRWIEVHPGRRGGKPCLDGTRLTAEEVASWWWSGLSIETMTREWPGLDHGAVLTCCWYQARYGTPLWCRRWRAWLPDADTALYLGQRPMTDIPLPPQRTASE